MRGNVLDMAIGIIMGVAFGAIITSLVNDVIMPPIGLLLGQVDFSSLYFNLSGSEFASLAAAEEAGAPVIKYGIFLNAILNFLIVAFVIFLLVRQVNKLKQKEEAPSEPTTRDCDYCKTEVPIAAVRCPHCTSELKAA